MTSPEPYRLLLCIRPAVPNTPQLHFTHSRVSPSHTLHPSVLICLFHSVLLSLSIRFPYSFFFICSAQYPPIFSLPRPWYMLFISGAGMFGTCSCEMCNINTTWEIGSSTGVRAVHCGCIYNPVRAIGGQRAETKTSARPSLPPSAPTVLRPLHRSATDLLELFTTLTRWASIKDRKDELEIDERERKDVTVSYEGWNWIQMNYSKWIIQIVMNSTHTFIIIIIITLFISFYFFK